MKKDDLDGEKGASDDKKDVHSSADHIRYEIDKGNKNH